MSGGATLEETARVMLRLGCLDAINLDGGGSSTLHLFGLTLNRPSDGKERPVANGVLFFDRMKVVTAPSEPVPTNGNGGTSSQVAGLRIRSPASLPVSASAKLALVNAEGATMRNLEVLWSATGAAWIDQGGVVRGLTEGKAVVSAWYRGRVVTADIQVTKPR
jgi:exopolysaccharide biosynthesis protein